MNTRRYGRPKILMAHGHLTKRYLVAAAAATVAISAGVWGVNQYLPSQTPHPPVPVSVTVPQ